MSLPALSASSIPAVFGVSCALLFTPSSLLRFASRDNVAGSTTAQIRTFDDVN